MVGTHLGNDSVNRRSMKHHLADFLKSGLVVVLTEGFGCEIGCEKTFDHRSSGFVTAVLIDAAQDRFKSAGEDRWFIAPAA